MWGIEDTELFLRRLLYVNLVTDPKGAFKKRWMFHQRNSSQLHRFDVRLNTVECSEEWESVIKATDDFGRSQSHGLPYTALESIHLYVSANMLRRPVIVLADTMARTVYGETIQDSQINGIYLPLEWPPEQCDKNPLVIGYNMNHFAPLLFEEDISPNNSDASVRAIPLVTKEMDSLPARYLMPNEEANYSNILRDYVNTTEVFYGTTSIPAAKVTLVPLPETVNIVDACRKDCERKFRRLMDPDPETTVSPFNFQVENIEPRSPAHHRQRADVPPERLNDRRKRCATIGCELFANPETQNLCSKCFNDFTIQYARQEEAARKIATRRPILPEQAVPFGQIPAGGIVPARQGSRGENFHDLSMMGEDCHAGCGFKCSTETYPYCHECYPKFVRTGTVAHQPQQVEPQRQPTQQDFSMMPETCHNPNCSYRCSKATYPYCHGCFPNFSSPTHAAPTAPPPSIPIVSGSNPSPVPAPGSSQDVHMRMQSSDETAVIAGTRLPQQGNRVPVNLQMAQNTEAQRQTEPMDVQIGSGVLNKKCTTLQCTSLALKGNSGYCEACYQLTLFGGGNPAGNTPTSGPAVVKCRTPGCNEGITLSEATQCVACFLKGDRSQCNSLTGSRTQTVGMNIVPTSEEKILNSGPTGNIRTADQARVFSLSGASMRSIPTEHDETGAQAPLIAPMTVGLQAEQELKYQSGEARKYICATPGCDGIRTDTEQGLCYTCIRKIPSAETAETQPPSGSNLNESTAYPSCSPVAPSKEEMKKLNPVVVSSRDKVKCASPTCDALIYPPKKLCDTCSAVLQRFQADRTKAENRKSVGAQGLPCKTKGCTFFGSQGTNGYCSSCFKAQVQPQRHTTPLTSRTRPATNTAPILSGHQQPETRHTVPIVVPSKAKLCIEKDCTRYGDPSQLERCSAHYERAISQYMPMSPASLEQQRQILAQQQQPQQPSTANRQTSRNRIETSGHHDRRHRPEVVPSHHNGTSQVVTGAAAATHQVANSSPHDGSFEQSYNKLISSKKSSVCKNKSRTGCSNFGNASKSGYCNTCYLELQGTSVGQNGFR
ncbi:tumor necrosis factor alpha-induced protein 3-like isoform X2 [Mercenaria mercenaria]|nr:tumor necrosis factor alpha-induced protein 3-like isoform X2 [Mercenaria mercenaria]